MAWGTEFTTNIFLIRQSLKTLSDVEDALKETEDMLKIYEQELLILASMSHKADNLEDLIFEIRTKVNSALEGYREECLKLSNLYHLKQHLTDGGTVTTG